MQVSVSDSSGTELVHDMLQIDGTDQFVWRLGLLPGTYTLKAVLVPAGSSATLPFTVPTSGLAPQSVEVHLQGR